MTLWSKISAVLIAVFSSGCAMQSALLISNFDRAAPVTKSTPMFLEDMAGASVISRERRAILREELNTSGFILVEKPDEALYVLRMKVVDIQSNVPVPTLELVTTNTTGSVGPYPISVQSTSTVTSSKTLVVPSRNAVIELVRKSKSDRDEQVWEGTIAMHSRVFDEYFRDALKKLLAGFGSNYRQQVFVP